MATKSQKKKEENMATDTHYEDRVERVLRLLVAFGLLKKYKKSRHSGYIDRAGVDFGVVKYNDVGILLQVKPMQPNGSTSSGTKKFRQRQKAGYVNPLIRLVAFPRNTPMKNVLLEVLYNLDEDQPSKENWIKVKKSLETLLRQRRICNYYYRGAGVWRVSKIDLTVVNAKPELKKSLTIEEALPCVAHIFKLSEYSAE